MALVRNGVVQNTVNFDVWVKSITLILCNKDYTIVYYRVLYSYLYHRLLLSVAGLFDTNITEKKTHVAEGSRITGWVVVYIHQIMLHIAHVIMCFFLIEIYRPDITQTELVLTKWSMFLFVNYNCVHTYFLSLSWLKYRFQAWDLQDKLVQLCFI